VEGFRQAEVILERSFRIPNVFFAFLQVYTNTTRPPSRRPTPSGVGCSSCRSPPRESTRLCTRS